MFTTNKARDGGRERVTQQIEMPASFFPDRPCSNMTVELPRELQRRLYKDLGMQAGDILVVTSVQGRRLEGRLLFKPNDCFLVEDDNFAALTM